MSLSFPFSERGRAALAQDVVDVVAAEEGEAPDGELRRGVQQAAGRRRVARDVRGAAQHAAHARAEPVVRPAERGHLQQAPRRPAPLPRLFRIARRAAANAARAAANATAAP